jgi:hypothetical protein
MVYANAALRKGAAHKQTAVAVQRVAFRAHERNTVFLRTFEDSV